MQLIGNSLRSLLPRTRTCLLPGRRHLSIPAPVAVSFEKFQGTGASSSPPLVILHGLFGSKQNWRGISRALERVLPRTIYTIDARNHGASPHSPEHSSRAMAEDLRLFLEQQGVPRAACLGHSMGGRSMIHFARLFPDLVERLIVVDISPVSVPRSVEEMSQIFDAMINVELPNTLSMSEGRKVARDRLMQATENATVDFIMLNLRKDKTTGAFSWACNAPVLRDFVIEFDKSQKYLEELAPYTGPTTFICGSRSPYMKLDHWPQVQQMFPNSELHWLDCGHLVHFEKPQEFIALVTEFLNRP
ncbi:hypothetical protein KR018_007943 [Drosophila ironensis]|nr:hypothetical protein KR018_007943 [Drosophila ironensis]